MRGLYASTRDREGQTGPNTESGARNPGQLRFAVPLSPPNRNATAVTRLLPEFGVEGQERLKAGSVLIVGAGGLGSPAALYLAAAGVGTIGLVDFDEVDVTNLQRQVLYGTAMSAGRR